MKSLNHSQQFYRSSHENIAIKAVYFTSNSFQLNHFHFNFKMLALFLTLSIAVMLTNFGVVISNEVQFDRIETFNSTYIPGVYNNSLLPHNIRLKCKN